MSGPFLVRLADNRVHLQHGPIDLIIEADGKDEAIEAAYAAAWRRFQTILEELVAELPILKQPLGDEPPPLEGKAAIRMLAACWPYRETYITPMAAVAGAVAEEILEAMVVSGPVTRVLVNNGGDIAIHLEEDEEVTLGVADRPDELEIAGSIKIRWADASRGVATSGWRGRSLSLGIADAVTVLARRAAIADAAATMIANDVTVEHPAIRRLPASEVKDDSDLGEMPVTVEVGPLPKEAVAEALERGEARAQGLLRSGLIQGAILILQGEMRLVQQQQHYLMMDEALI